jgi:phospholipid/cholesterol/gamma-HCH transport system substrate-binding protein
MEPEAKYTLVGAAALILVALLAAAVMWLRSSGEGANASRYTIYFQHYSLEGLEPRSYVTMRGMRVGSVTGFRFSSKTKGAVEVTIAVDPATPVRQSTSATTERHMVTGLATVRLSNATEESPLLVEAPPGEPFPVIREGESAVQQMSDTLTQLAQRADETMRRLNATLTPENVAAFTEILDNLRRVSRRADATFASVGGAADELRALASSIKADAATLSERYATLGTDATASIGEIREAVRRMSADVSRLSQRTEALLASGDEELRDSARAVRSAAESLGAAAARLRDPRNAIYGPAEGSLGPGEQSR